MANAKQFSCTEKLQQPFMSFTFQYTTVTVTRNGEKIKLSDNVHNLNHTCIFLPYQERCTFS